MKLLLVALCAGALVASASATVSLGTAAIAGYWGSIQGGVGSNYPQRFACTASPVSKAVTCTGVNVPGGTYPITAGQPIEPVIAVGQRIIPKPGFRFPTWQLDFSGEFGGTYILVAYNANTIVNFTPGQDLPNRLPTDLSGLFVWKLIAK